MKESFFKLVCAGVLIWVLSIAFVPAQAWSAYGTSDKATEEDGISGTLDIHVIKNAEIENEINYICPNFGSNSTVKENCEDEYKSCHDQTKSSIISAISTTIGCHKNSKSWSCTKAQYAKVLEYYSSLKIDTPGVRHDLIFCEDTAKGYKCGNTTQEGVEECDAGPEGDAHCSKQCYALTAPFLNCGNHKINKGEVCDGTTPPPGGGVLIGTCASDCRSIIPSTCGNGQVETGFEDCDWSTGDKDCSKECKIIQKKSGGSGAFPSGGPGGFPAGQKSICGNGVLEPGEECDDHNPNSGDGCSNDCKKEAPSAGGSNPGGNPGGNNPGGFTGDGQTVAGTADLPPVQGAYKKVTESDNSNPAPGDCSLTAFPIDFSAGIFLMGLPLFGMGLLRMRRRK